MLSEKKIWGLVTFKPHFGGKYMHKAKISKMLLSENEVKLIYTVLHIILLYFYFII